MWGGLDEETSPQLVLAGQFILGQVGEMWGGLDEETSPQLIQAGQFIRRLQGWSEIYPQLAFT